MSSNKRRVRTLKGGRGRNGFTYFRGESGGFCCGAEKLGCSSSFGVFDFLIVEEANGRVSPYDPKSILLCENLGFSLQWFGRQIGHGLNEWFPRTSRRVTGFSSRDRCVSLVKFLSTSRSASSAKLFEVKTKVRRFGIELGRVGWMVVTRLRARRRVWSLGESGKFPSTLISLSVKSIASWSCQRNIQSTD